MELTLVPEEIQSSALAKTIWTTRVQPGLFKHLRHLAVTTKDSNLTISIESPINLEVIGEISSCVKTDVEEALRRAQVAQATWEKVPIKERCAIIMRYHDLVLDRQEELMDIMQIETGKARIHAFEEVFDVANTCRYYANVAPSLLAPESKNGAVPLLTNVTEYHHPVGVVGMIAPWNYPLTLAVTDAIPAILAGNAVVLKPAEQTSFTALRAVELLIEAGLPMDVMQVVTGTGPEIGPALIEGSDFMMFTGSTQTGRIVAGQAGERLIKCSMELGGKNPMIVCADADLEAAATGAVRGSFGNAGQLCISFERIYVHRTIYEAFKAAFVRKTKGLRLGTDFSLEVEMGSLVSKMQLDKVKAHVEDAVSKGAMVLAGGKHRPDLGPYFFEPTILENVSDAMSLKCHETFGPVVSLYVFEDEEEVLQRANDTEYGLNAAVWSNDTKRAARLARRIKAGTVNVNETYGAAWASLDAPMGGMKASGIGRRHGAEGLLKYTESQTVAIQHLHPIARPDFMTGEQFADLATSALRLMKWIPGVK